MRAIQALIFVCVVLILAVVYYSSIVGSNETRAEIVGLSAPTELFEGRVLRLGVMIRNTGSKTGKFYVGASILIVEGREWINLPGWGYTPDISPDNSSMYFFGGYKLKVGSAYGYYDVNITVWQDSSKTRRITDRLYPARSRFVNHSSMAVSIRKQFVSEGEGYKNFVYIRSSMPTGTHSILTAIIEEGIGNWSKTIANTGSFTNSNREKFYYL